MRKAIIINDSRLEKAVLKDQLTRLGYKVEIADEYDWLDKIQNLIPDIAIVNYTMQHISGDKIIAAINTKFPNTKCYLSSCNKLREKQFPAIELTGMITTPITLDDLENTLINKISFCPFCGKALNQSFSFCPFCGEKIAL